MKNYDLEVRQIKKQLMGLDTYRGVRITQVLAKEILLKNETMIDGGKVYYLQIFNLGLGICEIRKKPFDKINTFLVKMWLHS